MQETKIRVCVVVPAYNAGKVIGRCLDSLKAQTFEDWMAMVIDDGSTDDTARIIAEYAAGEPRVLLLEGKHAGASEARNQALDAVERLHPAYVTFLDADDYLEPDALEAMMQTAYQTGADVIHCKYFSEFVNGYRYEPVNLFPDGSVFCAKSFPKTVYWKMMTGIQMNHVCTKLYRAELIRGVRLDPTMSTGEDLMMNVEIFTRAGSYAYLARPLYHYIRDAAQSLTNAGVPAFVKLKCNWKVSRRMLELLPQWGMDTLWYRLCVVCRPLMLVASKLYRGAMSQIIRTPRPGPAAQGEKAVGETVCTEETRG